MANETLLSRDSQLARVTLKEGSTYRETSCSLKGGSIRYCTPNSDYFFPSPTQTPSAELSGGFKVPAQGQQRRTHLTGSAAVMLGRTGVTEGSELPAAAAPEGILRQAAGWVQCGMVADMTRVREKKISTPF